MRIVKDKTYSVSSSRYGFEEKEHWVNDNKRVIVTTLWKGGTIGITPRTNEEVNLLSKALQNGSEDVFKPYDFSDTEFNSSHDGTTEDTEYVGWTEKEELEGIIDETMDGVDEEGIHYLEENGYYIDESDVYFLGEIYVEEG